MSEAIVPPVGNGVQPIDPNDPLGPWPARDDRIAAAAEEMIAALGADFRPVEPESDPRALRAVELSAFLDLAIPEPEMIVAPILKAGALVEVFAKAGVGKTMFSSIGLACHISTGQDFLGWTIKQPASVMVVDGEMSSFELQKRLNMMVGPLRDQCAKAGKTWEKFWIVTPDQLPRPIQKLDSPEGALALLDLVKLHPEVKVIILDNLSCLTAPEDENSAAGWAPVQDLMLMLRRRGMAVIIVHHAGKNGNQRGTSKRDDILDLVVKLAEDLEDHSNDGKTRIVVSFEKARNMTGSQKKPFTAILSQSDDGKSLHWTRDPKDRPIDEMVRSMLLTGMPVTAIIEELGCASSYAYRIKDGMDDELKDSQARKHKRKVVPFNSPSRGKGGRGE